MSKIRLGDVCKKIGSGFTPRGGKSVYKSSGIALIRSQNVLDISMDKTGLAYISNEQAEIMNGVIVQKDDVLLNITGDSVARVSLVNEEFLPARVNQHVAIIRVDKNIILPSYLQYFLHTQKKYLLQIAASNSTRNALTKEIISELEIKLPSLKTQTNVALVLDLIQCKIKSNKSINDNLEKQLRTIYDYWFTQFDFPDEKGKPYRSSGGKMVWNEELKREIPEGWSVMPLLNYVSWESNSQPPKSEFVYSPKKGYVRFIQNRDYDSDGYKTYIPYKHSLSMVDKFDILMDKYGDAGAIRYGIAGAFNVALGKICVHDADMQEYIRSYLGSAAVYNYLHNSCMASTRASLSENNLSFLKIIVPSKELLKKYQEIAHKMRSLILDCLDQNRQCVAIRDWLLPMLMNGQATVAD